MLTEIKSLENITNEIQEKIVNLTDKNDKILTKNIPELREGLNNVTNNIQ